ncbi:endonuclease domain-containing protein [Sphingomonas arantia]
MRKEPTPFEEALWLQLRGSRLAGLKFRRQTVIGSVIVDFFCPAIGLVVEVDGDTHDAAVDSARDTWLGERGFTVLRFSNADVGRNLNGVLEAIVLAAGACRARFTHPPAPSLEREGE